MANADEIFEARIPSVLRFKQALQALEDATCEMVALGAVHAEMTGVEALQLDLAALTSGLEQIGRAVLPTERRNPLQFSAEQWLLHVDAIRSAYVATIGEDA